MYNLMNSILYGTMFSLDIVNKENENEFFEKCCEDKDCENFDFTFEIEDSPSLYTRKKRGYRRTAAKNRFRGQRDSEYSFSHENRAYNHLCKEAVSETRSSSIKRGYNDYLDDIEEEQRMAEDKIEKENYKTFLIEERNKAALTILISTAKINAIDAELASIASE